MIRISLDSDTLETLLRGEVATLKGFDRRDTVAVEMCLQDIGFAKIEQMLQQVLADAIARRKPR